MQTQFHLLKASKESENYYEHVVDHCQNAGQYLIQDHEAIRFMLGMGRIEIDGASFSSGQQLVDYITHEQHRGSAEMIFPHKSLVVFCKLIDYHPFVLVTTTAARMLAAIPELLGGASDDTNQKIEVLMQARGESQLDALPDEDPADAVIIFRPDLILLSDCYEDLRKLGYIGVIMEPGLIQIPYEHWKGGVHIQVTPVRDTHANGFRLFEDRRLWRSEYFYVPKSFLSTESAAIAKAA